MSARRCVRQMLILILTHWMCCLNCQSFFLFYECIDFGYYRNVVVIFYTPSSFSSSSFACLCFLLYGSWELQLKGSGTTPFCRGADGRAVLRSSVIAFVQSNINPRTLAHVHTCVCARELHGLPFSCTIYDAVIMLACTCLDPGVPRFRSPACAGRPDYPCSEPGDLGKGGGQAGVVQQPRQPHDGYRDGRRNRPGRGPHRAVSVH